MPCLPRFRFILKARAAYFGDDGTIFPPANGYGPHACISPLWKCSHDPAWPGWRAGSPRPLADVWQKNAGKYED